MTAEQGIFSSFFAEGKDGLKAKMEGCRDLTEVEDAIRLFWDAMQRDFSDKVSDQRSRELGYEMLVVSKSAISCMLSVSQADILFKAQTMDAQERRPKSFDWKKYIGAGASALLGAFLLMQGMWIPTGIAAFVTVWQTVALRRDEIKINTPPALPEATGVPKADVNELLRRLERLAYNMDTAYERMLGEAHAQALPDAIKWTPAQLEAVQMLWEALHLEDGAYALKTLPQLIMSLEQQGLTVKEYSEETAGCFDRLPGVVEGYTIRPALMLGDRVIARGQVTQAMTAQLEDR